MRALLAGLVLLLALPAGVAARDGGDPARGKQLYQSRCFGCHSPNANRVGPRHAGVYGRRAGGVEDYAYSPAVKGAELVWDETALDAWLADPERVIPGQRMNYRLSDAAERRHVIAYLKQLSER